MTADPAPPLRRESFNEDAVGTTAEMAARAGPSRSILKALEVRPASIGTLAELVEYRHYLHSIPAAIRACFAVYLGDELHGAIVFTAGGRNSYRLLDAGSPAHTLTLARLWLSDDLPGNSESRVLGVVLRHLRRTTDYKLVISYADPAAGHEGIIYRAAGWLYLGETEPARSILLADGLLHHARSVGNRYGTNAVGHLTATGLPAMQVYRPGKLRYVYVLDPAWRWRLRARPLPYPQLREQSRAPPDL